MNAAPSTRAVIATILAKDLRVELRTLQSVPAMVLFSTTIYVIFRFGLDRTRARRARSPPGVLLVTILFAALLAINRLFVAEREQGGFEAIRLAPVDGTALFFAKAAALVVYLVALELVALPVFWLFFLDDGAGLLPLLPVLLLLNLALAVDRRADLADRDQLDRPRPDRAADPAAAARPADDRRERRRASACSRRAAPITTATEPGWECSACTI